MARSLSSAVIVDPAEGIEIIESTHPSPFPGVITMDPPLQALEAAKKYQKDDDEVWWSDGSKLEDGRIGAAAVHLDKTLAKWQSVKKALGNKQKVFDAKL